MTAASKAFLSFLLINLSSYFNLSLCDGSVDFDQLLPGLGQSAIANAQCMQKLLPCQPFLKAPNDPPSTCCGPLKEIATNSSDCLCQFINDPKFFLSLEVSKDEILKLPKACGIKVDTSKCNANAGNAVDDEAVTKDTSEESTSSTTMITPYGITYFGIPGFVAMLTALVFSAY